MSEKALITRPKPSEEEPQTVRVGDARKQIGALTTKDFYSVEGRKNLPGVKVARVMAIEEGISTEIIEWGKDDQKTWSKVRAWKGPKENPSISTEKIVIQLYSHLLKKAVFDAIDNGLWIVTGKEPNGRPIRRRIFPEVTILLRKTLQIQNSSPLFLSTFPLQKAPRNPGDRKSVV